LGGWRGGNNVVRGLKTGNFEVNGANPNMTQIEQIKIDSGRFINENDMNEKRKVCVIGDRVREELFKTGEQVLGAYVRINGVYFNVIGITKAESRGQNGNSQAKKIIVPFSTFQQAFNFGDLVGWYAIVAVPEVPAAMAEKKVLALLRERHKIAPNDELAIGHWNMGEQYGKMNGLFDGINILIWFVGIGTLIAGVIGISNIMLIVVKERTREIGVKRALGATPLSIVSQIITESVCLTAISGYFGLLAGILLLELVNSVIGNEVPMFNNPTVDLHVALTALTVLVISGALAGLIPARKAVAILPVEALRAT
jgi:putative ABC transport system permease protein